MSDDQQPPTTTAAMPTSSPMFTPTATTNLQDSSSNVVQDNFLARQVLKAQDRIQDHFSYNASMDAVFWIHGATAVCKHSNVHDESAIAQILSSELWNCAPIQEDIGIHLSFHQRNRSTCSKNCLVRFCLDENSIYTKPTSVITSALSRYQKPSDMDVQEHLVAHLRKEEDLLRRRDPSITDQNVSKALYGSTTDTGKQVNGACEDSAIARILDSLRSTEPFLMEHLNNLELIQVTSGWTLKSLLKAIRSYERKMYESFHTSVQSDDSAMISHYKAKSKSRADFKGIHPYNFYDPTTYTSHLEKSFSQHSEPSEKKRKIDESRFPQLLPQPSLMASIDRLSTVTETLNKMYSSSRNPSASNAQDPTHPTQSNTSSAKSSSRRRVRPTHCLRCGSNKHLIWECKEEEDDKAAELRQQHEESSGFRPNPRFKEHGRSLAHTWAYRERLWPKSWFQNPADSGNA